MGFRNVEGTKRPFVIAVFEAGDSYLHRHIVPDVYMIPAFSAKWDIYPGAGGIYALSSSCSSFLGGEGPRKRQS